MMRFPANSVLRRAVRRAKQAFRPSCVILLYHRIGNGTDRFRNCVTVEHFASHLEILRKYAKPVALQTLIRNCASRQPVRSAVAVTFDDGYGSTFDWALPLLEHYKMPATVFVVAGMLNSIREFWWDQLDYIFSLPGFDHAELNHYYARLQHAKESERPNILSRLWSRSGQKPPIRTSHRVMDSGQLRQMAKSPFIELGAHTMTHPVLTRLDTVTRSAEIINARNVLRDITGITPMGFSYPHGVYDESTIDVVRSCGYEYACCSRPRGVASLGCVYSIPRFAVPDWDGETFSSKLEGWLASPAVSR